MAGNVQHLFTLIKDVIFSFPHNERTLKMYVMSLNKHLANVTSHYKVFFLKAYMTQAKVYTTPEAFSKSKS